MSKLTSEDDDSQGTPPDFANREHGIAVWINTTQSGDEYLTVELPLNLGRVNLFKVEDNSSD